MVPDEIIADILTHHTNCEPTCRALVDAANASGGRDNTTVIVVKCMAAVALK